MIEWAGGRRGYTSPESAESFIKLRKFWENEKGKELFEGFWEVEVVYNEVLRRTGYGERQDYRGSFWAIEGMSQHEDKDEEEEGEEGEEEEE
jgi:hypothetical protein